MQRKKRETEVYHINVKRATFENLNHLRADLIMVNDVHLEISPMFNHTQTNLYGERKNDAISNTIMEQMTLPRALRVYLEREHNVDMSRREGSPESKMIGRL